jgi:hypothetical protein
MPDLWSAGAVRRAQVAGNCPQFKGILPHSVVTGALPCAHPDSREAERVERKERGHSAARVSMRVFIAAAETTVAEG